MPGLCSEGLTVVILVTHTLPWFSDPETPKSHTSRQLNLKKKLGKFS